MKCLIRSEIYKTMKQKYFLFLISGAIVLGIATIGLNQSLVSNHPQIVNTGYNILVSSLRNISVSIILCSIFIHFHVGNEFANRTITTMIESGFSRKDIYLSKIVTCNFYCVGLMLAYPIVSCLGTVCLNGWGKNILIIDILKNIFIFLILNLSILTFCIVIEFLIENNIISLIINILIIGVGTEILIGVSTEFPFLEKLLNITPVSKINIVGAMTKTTEYVIAIMISIIWGSMILLIGYYRFRKLDIK